LNVRGGSLIGLPRLAAAALMLLVALPATTSASSGPLFPRKTRLAAQGAAARAAAVAAGMPQRFAPGELLVTYRRAISASQRRSVAAAVHGRELTWNATVRMQQLRVAPTTLSTAAEVLRRSRRVAGVERNPLADIEHVSCVGNAQCAIPNDPFFTRQWWLQNDAATVEPAAGALFGADVAAPLAWRVASGSTAVLVAVVDSGIDRSHPDVGPRVIASATLVGNGGDVNDYVGHGTAVAGVIAAIPNNGIGVAGVAWNASLINIKAQSDSGPGGLSCAAAVNGITYATNAGAHIINLSFGGPTPCANEQAAIDYATGRGSLVIAAAGNDGNTVPEYPAAFANVIAVAATDDADQRADFSSYGSSWVDLAAPGVAIWTTLPVAGSALGTGYGYVDGTSFSAPIVAGIAALIWPTVADANGDGRRNDDVARRLIAYADTIPGTGTLWQYGRVNACRAAAAGAQRCPPPAPSPTVSATPAPTPVATPAATPAPKATPVPVPVMPLSIGRQYVHRALRDRLGTEYARRRGAVERCEQRLRTEVLCRVSWATARWVYWGVTSVWYTASATEVLWHGHVSLHRASGACARRHGRSRCPSRPIAVTS
jgi:thermitase